jgi:hypothetical protein
MHFSDNREPKNQSNTHWSVPQIDNFNSKESGGAEHDPSRDHIQGPVKSTEPASQRNSKKG